MPDGPSVEDEPVPGVCVGCGRPAATPRDLVCVCCAALLEREDRAEREGLD